jgi:hypothetical protein
MAIHHCGSFVMAAGAAHDFAEQRVGGIASLPDLLRLCSSASLNPSPVRGTAKFNGHVAG